MNGEVLKFKNRVENSSFLKIIGVYFLTMFSTLIISIVFFFFPLMPICYVLNIEFSNLGPIATFAWGVCFNLFVVTPIFFYAIFVKSKYVLRR